MIRIIRNMFVFILKQLLIVYHLADAQAQAFVFKEKEGIKNIDGLKIR